MSVDYIEYANKVRDVYDLVDYLQPKLPAFLSLVTDGSPVFAQKYEWLEDTIDGWSSSITAFDTTGDGTGITVTDTTNLIAGSILRVETSGGATRSEQLVVASVDSSTEITVTRDYAGTTGVTLVTGDVLVAISVPTQKGSTYQNGINFQSSTAFNYTQIFDTTAIVALSDIESNVYGNENAIDYQERRHLEMLFRHLNNAMIHGVKQERTSTQKGAMGGILQFLAGGNVTAVGGALASSQINVLLENMFNNGAGSSNIGIVCAPNQARKISAFNTSGSNPLLNRDVNDTRTGSYVTSFVGDLPVMGANMAQVVVEPNFPKDQLAVVDMDRVSLHALGNRSFTSKLVGENDDALSKRLIGEYTVKVMNGQKAHGLLTGLTV